MSAEATLEHPAGEQQFIAAAALTSGEVIQLPGGKAGIVGGLKGFAINDEAVVYTAGVFAVASDSAILFTKGQDVIWDASANTAVVGKAKADTADFRIGKAYADKASGDLVVLVDLNAADELFADRVIEAVTLAGGSKTLDAEDVAKVMLVTTGHATNVVTLPATAAGLEFIVAVGTTGQRVAVSPNSSDKIMGPDQAGADDKDMICAAATSLSGDFIHLRADASAGWYIVRMRGIWAAEG